MSLPGRKRRLTRWWTLWGTASVLATWAISEKWYFGVDKAPSLRICVCSGALIGGQLILPPKSPLESGLTAGPATEEPSWGFSTVEILPLWMVAAPLVVVTTVLWWPTIFRWKKPPAAHVCARCGYSRAGLAAAAPCPECGTT